MTLTEHAKTDAKNDFEQLARQWEREAVAAGRAPGDMTPRDVAVERSRKLADMLAKHWKGGAL